MASPKDTRLTAYEKIIAHNDFDGIISASLCCWAFEIPTVFFTGPLAIIRSQITVTDKDIVCDLPYPLECGLWFDHHEGNLQELALRKIDAQSLPGRFDLKPSCSRVVFEYLSEREKLPCYFLEAVEEADIIDSFSYASIEDWRRETPGNLIDLTLKVSFQSANDRASYMRNLVQQLRDRPIEEVSRLEFVQKRLKKYREEEVTMLRIIEKASYFFEEDPEKEIIVLDLTSYQRTPHLIKNLAFLIYPGAMAVLEVYNLVDYQGVKSNDIGLSMSLSIRGNRQRRTKNIGEIMRTLNIGDGHPGAAAGTVHCRSKQEMLKKKKELLEQILRLWSSQ